MKGANMPKRKRMVRDVAWHVTWEAGNLDVQDENVANWLVKQIKEILGVESKVTRLAERKANGR